MVESTGDKADLDVLNSMIYYGVDERHQPMNEQIIAINKQITTQISWPIA